MACAAAGGGASSATGILLSRAPGAGSSDINFFQPSHNFESTPLPKSFAAPTPPTAPPTTPPTAPAAVPAMPAAASSADCATRLSFIATLIPEFWICLSQTSRVFPAAFIESINFFHQSSGGTGGEEGAAAAIAYPPPPPALRYCITLPLAATPPLDMWFIFPKFP